MPQSATPPEPHDLDQPALHDRAIAAARDHLAGRDLAGRSWSALMEDDDAA